MSVFSLSRSHIVIISRPHSTHSLAKVLVPVVFIRELTNAVLTGCQGGREKEREKERERMVRE